MPTAIASSDSRQKQTKTAQEFKSRNQFRQLCCLAGRYDYPIPTRFSQPPYMVLKFQHQSHLTTGKIGTAGIEILYKNISNVTGGEALLKFCLGNILVYLPAVKLVQGLNLGPASWGTSPTDNYKNMKYKNPPKNLKLRVQTQHTEMKFLGVH